MIRIKKKTFWIAVGIAVLVITGIWIICRAAIVPLKPVCVHALSCRVIGGEVKIVKGVIFACYFRT
jgi:hypothetical protein